MFKPNKCFWWIYLWLGLRVDMFITSDASEKQFPTGELFAQTDIQSNFRVINMEAYK